MKRREVLTGLALWSLAGAPAALAQTGLGLNQNEAALGLREALLVGARTVTTQLGQTDGFFGNPRVRIPLPGSLARAQRTLRPLRLSGPLDDLELRVNRGAEQAMPQAWALFERTIRSITLTDALSILRGGDNAATQFLRGRTEGDLTRALRPILEGTLQGAGAFTALDRASRSAGLAGTSQNLRGQLIDFSVTRALDAAFSLLADEERAIRRDPVRRTSDILRRVFGR
jgi:hypothetical protein